jgi:hypothetical protein
MIQDFPGSDSLSPKKVRHLKISISFCLLLVLALGCQGQVSTQSPAPTAMSGRLDAALAMKVGTSRHNALVKLAEEAANAGDGDVVLKAIAAVDAGTARDNTCSICSQALAKQGKSSQATKVAKQIANETSRNNMLAKIATGGE